MNIPPHVASWALGRVWERDNPPAEFTQLVKQYERMPARQRRTLSAEPISIGAAIIGVFTATAVPAAVSWAVGTAVLIGASIAVNYAASALMQKSGSGPIATSQYAAETAVNSTAIKYNERQPIPSKRIIYGTAQVGGALFFEEVKPPYLYQGWLICAKKIASFRKMWIGTQEIAFQSLVPNTILTPIAVYGQPNFPGRLKVSLRLGDANQAIDPILAADFPDLDPEFRQRGIATAVVRYHYGADYTEYTELWGQSSRPNPYFLVDGVAVPDPRRPGHVLEFDPSDDAAVAAAEATWEFSNNATLIQAHYLTQRYGGRIDPRRFDWAKTAVAADWDDGLVWCLDGTYIRRHTIDGVVTLNQSPANIVSGMLSANRGMVLQSAGKVWPSSSIPRQPVVTIHDGLLTGAVDYRAAKPKRDLINRLKVRFVAEDREYQTADGPVLSRDDLKAADGELLDATLDLPFTMDHRRAQRLEKAFLENARLGKQLVVKCDVLLLANCSEELIGNAVTFDSVLFASANGTYLCTDWSFADNFSSINVSLVGYDAAIETDYRAAVDEKPFVLAPLDVS
ncbi:hypothetical protein RPMA_12490 [Tardiphaga alba]|uniref:Tip attachment protein J domain-containing protein n=1 Tax=Tardiphaga alba TaxID=340268 RepID=A0ABX8A7D3_9BRAD|nr:hypothetical protein [Tardiphaga alba]QUS39564.1 hypothetical protein RPMA_12490 [Tardiphaga alba]